MKITLIFLMMALSPVKSRNHEYTTDDIKTDTTEFKAKDLSKNEYASSDQDHPSYCSLFDEPWDQPTYIYSVPIGSFCHGYDGGVACLAIQPFGGVLEPFKVECEPETAPIIHFYFDNNDKCDVNTANGINKNTNSSKNNEKCIEKVRNHFKGGDKSNSKLIYMTHGFDSTKYPDHWLFRLKDALISRYKKERVVVAVVFWIHGARWIHGPKESSKETSIRRATSSSAITDWMNAICCMGKIELFGDYARYGTAAVTTWSIGNILGYVHQSILGNNKSNLNIKTFCIGHSLGSHVCGFFGKMTKRLMIPDNYSLEKIIGLDPAGPLFDYEAHDITLRLNRDDAKIVEVFHTNTQHFGFKKPIGDIDFFINGGETQYWCKKDSMLELLLDSVWEQKTDDVTCSHEYAWVFLKLLAISLMPCYARWNSTNGMTTTFYNDKNSNIRLGEKQIDGSDAKIFYPGDLDSSNIPLGKHYLYIRPKDSKICFVCDDIEFSISDKSLIRCRQSIFRPEGKGVLIKGVVVDSGPYPYRQRLIRATRTSGSIVTYASRSLMLILFIIIFHS